MSDLMHYVRTGRDQVFLCRGLAAAERCAGALRLLGHDPDVQVIDHDIVELCGEDKIWARSHLIPALRHGVDQKLEAQRGQRRLAEQMAFNAGVRPADGERLFLGEVPVDRDTKPSAVARTPGDPATQLDVSELWTTLLALQRDVMNIANLASQISPASWSSNTVLCELATIATKLGNDLLVKR